MVKIISAQNYTGVDTVRTRMYAYRLRGNGCVHTSPNVTKGVLDWEYTREILHSDLRTYLTDPLQTASARLVPSREGSCSQGPGALHDQDFPYQPQASGGDGHV